MVAKAARFVVKAVAVIFTSIMAPVLVYLTVHNLDREPGRPNRCEQKPIPKKELARPVSPSAPALAPSPHAEPTPRPWCPVAPAPAPAPSPVEITQVIVQGAGWTPGEALQDALRNALHQALAAQVDAATWAKDGQAIFEAVSRNSGGLVLGWKELKSSKEWRLRGSLHHKEVAVEVNRLALVERLRETHQADLPDSAVVWRPAGSGAKTRTSPIP